MERAWRDELATDAADDLPPAEREIRDAAAAAFRADPLAAVLSVDLDDLDELEALLSWVNDPVIGINAAPPEGR